MTTIITQYWPLVLTVFGGIVAVSKFYLDWLRIRELRYKLSEAELKKNRDSSPIIPPTPEEISKYSVKEFVDYSKSSSILSIVFVSFISLSIYKSNQYVYISKEDSIGLNYVDELENLKLMEEINILSSNFNELRDASSEAELENLKLMEEINILSSNFNELRDASSETELENIKLMEEINILSSNFNEVMEAYKVPELVEINVLSTDRGHEFWSNASKVEFQLLFESQRNHILYGDKQLNLNEFETLDLHQYRAEFIHEDIGLTIEVKYLLIGGPQKYWFMAERVKSHNKTLQQTSR